MIDTSKYEGHTPGPWWIEEVSDNGNKDTWLMGNFPEDNMLFCMEWAEGNDTDLRLIADAPLLLEEVKRLRGQLGQAREFLWWCYDKERFGWEIDEKGWNLIGRLLGAYTDHNDNEWSEEE